MRRQILFWLLTTLLLTTASITEAQQDGKFWRIGLLNPSSSSGASTRVDSFRQGLRELGYVEGKNILIEARYGEAKQDRLLELGKEIVGLKVDAIVTATTPGVLAAKKATSTIPIVFAGAGDPVKTGLVSSLARPGGNITGLSILSPELDSKRLELLKETFPKITRVAHVWDPAFPGTGLAGMQATAPALGIQLQLLEVRTAKDFEAVFETILKKRTHGITVAAVPIMTINQKRIVEFAAKNRLPGIYPYSEFVNSGGLMFYGVSIDDLYRRAAVYVDKILKGSKPADLPVELPKKFEFSINLKTAKQIGLTIPPNVLARADKVIR